MEQGRMAAEKRGVVCKGLLQNGKCKADERRYCTFDPQNANGLFDEALETIERGEICGRRSIFGNSYLTITAEQIEDLKAGRILLHFGEYGTFIMLEGKDGETT